MLFDQYLSHGNKLHQQVKNLSVVRFSIEIELNLSSSGK